MPFFNRYVLASSSEMPLFCNSERNIDIWEDDTPPLPCGLFVICACSAGKSQKKAKLNTKRTTVAGIPLKKLKLLIKLIPFILNLNHLERKYPFFPFHLHHLKLQIHYYYLKILAQDFSSNAPERTHPLHYGLTDSND